jgi:hypothetical protein
LNLKCKITIAGLILHSSGAISPHILDFKEFLI